MARTFNKRLHCAKDMPKLKHKIGEHYNVSKSEVVRWLINQPDIQDYIFRRVTDGGEDALIKYNPDTGEWQGVNYDPDDD